MTMAAANKLVADIWAQIERAKADNHAANPEKYKRSRFFPDGLRYRYFETKRPRRPTIRWCYTSTKNAAGYYLCFRQTVTQKAIKVDEVSAFQRKKDAIETARLHDAKLRNPT